YVLTGTGIYGFVLEATGRRRPSLVASFLAISTPAIWVSWEMEGVYAMTIATGLIPLTLWALLRYLRGQSKKHLLAAISTMTLSLLSQLLVAAITSFAAALIILLYVRGIKRKISTGFRILAPAVLISAYFYLPFLTTRPEEQYGFVSYNSEIWAYILSPQRNMFLPLARRIDSWLSPLILPLIGVVLLKYHGKIKIDEPTTRATLAIGITSILLFAYTTIPTGWHLSGFEPSNSLHFLSIFLAMICGLLLGQTASHIRHPQIMSYLIVLIVLLSFIYYPVSYPFSYYPAHKDSEEIERLLRGDEGETMFRFGMPPDERGISQWFNYRYAVPQTRHWYAQGVIGGKWLYWLFHVVWQSQGCYEETSHALDWYAVKWFITLPYISPDGAVLDIHAKFLADSERYEHVVQGGDLHGFIYREAAPIISASNRPTVLIIGTTDNMFKALALSSSRRVIPVWGREHIDDHSLEELSNFDAIVLYGYNYHNKAEAWSLLEAYVEAGGGLLVETGFSPDSGSSSMPAPCPVDRTLSTDFGMEWSLADVESPVTSGVDFSSFSPALFGDFPWGVSASYNESVRPWARPVLWIEGRPLVAVGEYGEGRVVWCGLNLPYHVTSYRNYWESLFLSKMVEWVSRPPVEESGVACEVSRPHPEKVIVAAEEEVGGVLFRENYFKNWHAYLVAGDARQDLDIYRAGPDFMYAQIPEEVDLPVEAVFEYGWTNAEIAGYAISLATIIGLIMYAAGIPLDRPARALFLNLLLWVEKRTKSWWR
ncbi:MAG: 6-pyruvoyl-tetrahydropterin synthase-related protein, partial [Candidatus Bathyarchaeota archaeon]|nr:6-pyruvoyl-tetrahydropterin synthase-related protein [Candidatus Bathyarchaeota archaeon]